MNTLTTIVNDIKIKINPFSLNKAEERVVKNKYVIIFQTCERFELPLMWPKHNTLPLS